MRLFGPFPAKLIPRRLYRQSRQWYHGWMCQLHRDFGLKSGLTKSNETSQKLYDRERNANPFRIAVVGAGTYGRTLISQVVRLPGLRLVALCDTDPDLVTSCLQEAGVDSRDCLHAGDVSELAGKVIDLIVDCTGSPEAGARIAEVAESLPAHLVMVNAEADACVGPELSSRIEAVGKVYTLADGDQPSLIVGLADWAESIGFTVVSAGKWTDAWEPHTAEDLQTQWIREGKTVSDSDRMFLDGTKAGIELASAANCLGFAPDGAGMHGPALGIAEIPRRFRATGDGAMFRGNGVVDYVNCVGVSRESVHPGGVFVVAESDNRTGMEAMARKGSLVSDDLRHVLFYRPYHLLGVETIQSVTRALLYGVPTAAPRGRYTEVVAVAKQGLKAGQILKGAGYELRGVLYAADEARTASLLPVGLAAGARLCRDVPAGTPLALDAVELKAGNPLRVLRADLSQPGRPVRVDSR